MGEDKPAAASVAKGVSVTADAAAAGADGGASVASGGASARAVGIVDVSSAAGEGGSSTPRNYVDAGVRVNPDRFASPVLPSQQPSPHAGGDAQQPAGTSAGAAAGSSQDVNLDAAAASSELRSPRQIDCDIAIAEEEPPITSRVSPTKRRAVTSPRRPRPSSTSSSVHDTPPSPLVQLVSPSNATAVAV